MPVAALCPSCGAPLSDASVVALAPICQSCGVVLTVIGGTLALTGVYGVNDPTFTRRRVEADLLLHQEYRRRYEGAIEDCKQKLLRPADHYAQLPQPPKLLALEDVIALKLTGFWAFYYVYLLPLLAYLSLNKFRWDDALFMVIPGLNWIFTLAFITGKDRSAFLSGLIFLAIVGEVVRRGKTIVANGMKPLENARRQKAYDDAFVAALKAAEPLKKAEDHRLRCQIRDSESLAETLGENEAKVRQLLATL